MESKNVMVLRPNKVLLHVLGYRLSAIFAPAPFTCLQLFIIISGTGVILNSRGQIVSNNKVSL